LLPHKHWHRLRGQLPAQGPDQQIEPLDLGYEFINVRVVACAHTFLTSLIDAQVTALGIS
jgi:hypothetical protein